MITSLSEMTILFTEGLEIDGALVDYAQACQMLAQLLRTGAIPGWCVEGGRVRPVTAGEWLYYCIDPPSNRMWALDGLPELRDVRVDEWAIYRMVEAPQLELAFAGSTPTKRVTYGRPKGSGFEAADAPLIAKMEALIKSGEATSFTSAAWAVAGKDGSGAQGAGTPEAKVARLVSRCTENNRE